MSGRDRGFAVQMKGDLLSCLKNGEYRKRDLDGLKEEIGMFNSTKDLKKYLDSQVDVTDNPHDNIFLYRHHMWSKHKIKSTDGNFFNKKFIEEYIKDMKSIGWKSPEDRIKFNKEVMGEKGA